MNKIDKDSARPEEVVDEVIDLFIELGAEEEQLDFPVVFASGIAGTSSLDPDPAKQEKNMTPLFETIVETYPCTN